MVPEGESIMAEEAQQAAGMVLGAGSRGESDLGDLPQRWLPVTPPTPPSTGEQVFKYLSL